MTTIRLACYNIRSMRDDRAAMARVLCGLRPDVACVQEVPRFLGWRRERAWAARHGGLAVGVGRRACGLAVLARPQAHLLAREYHLLSAVRGLHRRALALALLSVRGVRFIAACVHLDLDDEARRVHAEEVVDLLEVAREHYVAPVVFAGDINERPDGPIWRSLAERFTDAGAVAPRGERLTYGSARPSRRIDGVFVDSDIEVIGCGVPETPELLADYPDASDHRPVLAELRLPRPTVP